MLWVHPDSRLPSPDPWSHLVASMIPSGSQSGLDRDEYSNRSYSKSKLVPLCIYFIYAGLDRSPFISISEGPLAGLEGP